MFFITFICRAYFDSTAKYAAKIDLKKTAKICFSVFFLVISELVNLTFHKSEFSKQEEESNVYKKQNKKKK